MRDQTSGDGTGIGLAIAKTIADFHNIEIAVSSEAGKGTTFIFHFPRNS
jgi:signal transduction histidine kinase